MINGRRKQKNIVKKSMLIIMGFVFLSCGMLESNKDIETEKLYICLQAQNQVAVYKTPELKLLKLIDLDYSNKGNTPHFVAIDEVNNFWFVTGLDGGYVAQFNLITDEFIDTISIGSNPALITIDPMNKTLFCSRMNMSDMPGMGSMAGMGGMGGMDNMVQTNVISEVHYTDKKMSLGREFILDSNVLHGITYDYNREYIITASITDDWLYKIPLNDAPVVSTTMDASVTEYVSNYPNNLQPLQIITLSDDLIAISCSAFKDGINGQLQIWNVNSMSLVTSYEFYDKSVPWHLMKSPIANEVFVVLGGSSGYGGLVCLTYSENSLVKKWDSLQSDFDAFHGITIDKNGEYVYVTSRGNHYLYQFQAVNGELIASSPLGAAGQIVSPGGISVMQNICINCE